MRRVMTMLIGMSVVLSACSADGDGDDGVAASAAPSATAPDAGTPDTGTSDTGTSGTGPADGTGTSGTGPTTTSPVVDVDEAVEALDGFGELLDDDGSLSFETALALFARSIRPLPGVEPSDQVVDEDGILLRRISLDLDRLTPEQRSVVDDVLGGPGTPLDQIIDGGGGASARFPRLGTVADAAPIVREAKALFDRRLGMSIPESFFVLVDLPMVEADGTRNFSGPLNAASASGEFEGGDVALRCRIRLNNDAAGGPGMLRSQIAHEVFHCYQYQVHGRNNWPLWAAEGGAGWVGEDFAGGSGMSGTWWARWINRPRMPLVTRSYDAIGLFALADRLGANTHQLAMDLTGSPFMTTLTATTGEEIFDLWGTHYGDAAWGAEWSVIGPAAPSTRAPVDAFTPVLDGGPSFVTDSRTDPGTAATPVEFVAPGDVLRMTGYTGLHGAVRFGDGTTVSMTNSGDFCLAAGGCACPEGSTGGGPTQPVASNRLFVGLGPGSASGPQFEALSLDHFCSAPAPTDTATIPAEDGLDSCIVGRWVSTRAIMPTDPSVNETVGGGAGVVQVFGADGSYAIDFAGMSPIEAVVDAPEDQRFKTSLTYSGSGTGTWSTSSGQVTATGLDLGAFRIDYRSEIIGIAVIVEDGFALNDPRIATLPGAGGRVGGGSYTCSGATLVITNEVPGYGAAGFEFARG